MMASFSYNIHNLIKFQVITKNHRIFSSYFNRFSHEFEYFKVDSIDKPDFVVEVGSFKPDNKGCVITEEGAFYIKKGYLYTNDSYKTAKWEVEISGLDSDVARVKVKCNLSGYLFFGSYIITFLLRAKMNQKGYPFIHGSGITHNGTAYIFPARSGSGKTVTTMHYLDNGYKLLGDNFVIVNRNKVLSFPSSMNIFYYNLAPRIKKSLSKSTLFVLKLKHLLYKLTLGYIKIFTPVSVKKLFPDQIVDSSKLKIVALMQVGTEFSIEKLSEDLLVQHLLYNNQLDAHPFIDYIAEYAFVYPDSWLSRHWEVLVDNYKNTLDEVEACYKITLPRFIDDEVLKKLDNFLDNSQ